MPRDGVVLDDENVEGISALNRATHEMFPPEMKGGQPSRKRFENRKTRWDSWLDGSVLSASRAALLTSPTGNLAHDRCECKLRSENFRHFRRRLDLGS